MPFSAGVSRLVHAGLLYKLRWVSFKSLLAGQAAKMIGLPIMGYLKLGCLVIHNCAANRIFEHYPFLNLTIELFVLPIMNSGKKEKGLPTHVKTLACKPKIFSGVFAYCNILGSILACFRQV